MTSETDQTKTSYRVQLNLRLDGKKHLLEAIKEAAKEEGTSVNAWAVKVFESALGMESTDKAPTVEDLELTVTSVLDKLLADKLINIKSELKAELLGEFAA
jgi:hypothetical protein